MAQFNKAIITGRGLNLIAKSQTGVQIQFTKIASGDGQWPVDTDFLSVIDLKNHKQTIDISSIVILNQDTVRVRGALTNNGLLEGYFIREIGLFAEDPDLGEILYCIVTAVTPDYFPANIENNQAAILIDVITTVSNADSVLTILNPDAVYATAEDLQELKEKFEVVKVEALTAGGIAEVIGQQVLQNKRILADLEGEIGQTTLTNSQEYPFNNSGTTVNLLKARDTLNYRVEVEVVSSVGIVGDVIVYDKQLNGFKIRHTGSATTVVVKYYVQGGMYQ